MRLVDASLETDEDILAPFSHPAVRPDRTPPTLLLHLQQG